MLMNKYNYIIDGEKGEMLFVWGNRMEDGIELWFGTAEYWREVAKNFHLQNYVLVEKWTVANLMQAYMDWDYEEKREIQLELIDILESADTFHAN